MKTFFVKYVVKPFFLKKTRRYIFLNFGMLCMKDIPLYDMKNGVICSAKTT